MFIIKTWSNLGDQISLRYRGSIDEAERLANEVGGAAFRFMNGTLYTIDEIKELEARKKFRK